jgi:uncharacterized protein (TIGR03663 family)
MSADDGSRWSSFDGRTPLSGRDPVLLAVLAVAVLALVARLAFLGQRVAHQDEARVAYWAYRYMESGVYWYRPIVHGPFLTLVNARVFSLFGATDFTMRAVVAVLGGLLPLSALLFRERLRDAEVVALSLVLAANPLLLYYSRFYRNDVLLAGFMLVAFGLFVRTVDTREPAYLYAGTATLALAFTTKENALVYLVAWVGAAALLLDRRLLVDRVRREGLSALLADRGRRAVGGLRRWGLRFALAFVEFFAIFVFFYAPRGEGAVPEPTLGATLADPTLLPALVGEATLGTWDAFVGQWGGGNEESYLSAAESLWPALETGGLVLVALAVAGFLLDRYTGNRPRDAVAFAAYWGFASALGYPVIVDNPFPWEVIHVVVPLAVPAAVGLAALARLGWAGLAERDRLVERSTVTGAAAALLVLVAAAQVGATAYDTSFVDSQNPDNDLVQYAQSSSEMKPLLRDVRETIRANEGTDVLFYGDDPDFDGDELYAPNPASHDTPTAGDGWYERLPFLWYFEAADATIDSANESAAVRRRTRDGERPPVVVAFGSTTACSEEYDNAADIDEFMTGYERHEVDRFLYESGCVLSGVVIYTDETGSGQV